MGRLRRCAARILLASVALRGAVAAGLGGEECQWADRD